MEQGLGAVTTWLRPSSLPFFYLSASGTHFCPDLPPTFYLSTPELKQRHPLPGAAGGWNKGGNVPQKVRIREEDRQSGETEHLGRGRSASGSRLIHRQADGVVKAGVRSAVSVQSLFSSPASFQPTPPGSPSAVSDPSTCLPGRGAQSDNRPSVEQQGARSRAPLVPPQPRGPLFVSCSSSPHPRPWEPRSAPALGDRRGWVVGRRRGRCPGSGRAPSPSCARPWSLRSALGRPALPAPASSIIRSRQVGVMSRPGLAPAPLSARGGEAGSPRCSGG